MVIDNLNSIDMIRKNIKYAFRRLIKKDLPGVSNIVLLALVTAVMIHLFKYVAFEKSFDKFNSDYKNIYRVGNELVTAGEKTDYAISLGLVGSVMKSKFGEVKSFVRVTPLSDGCTIVYGDVVFRENRVFEVDSNFFNFFSYPLVIGDPSKVLKDPNTVVLAESSVKKYFKNDNPIGKEVKIKGKYGTYNFKITGVYKDFPPNSHMQMDWICSDHHLFEVPHEYYHFDMAMNHWTYVELANNVNVKDLVVKVDQELDRLDIYKTSDVKVLMTPLADIHLKSELQSEMDATQGGNYDTIILLEWVGIFCFLITFLNFINISMVKTIDRSREVGIRSVMGATYRDNLILFFTEAMLHIGLALILAVGFYFATVGLVGKYLNLSHDYSISADEVKFYLISAGVIILIGMLTSLLYAFIFSKAAPIYIMRKKNKIIGNKISWKAIPIIVQFSICIFFLSFTIMVFKQVNYILNKDLGYNKENIIFIVQPHMEDFWNLPSKMEAFDNEARKSPNILGVSRAVYNPGSNGYAQWGGISSEKTGKDNFMMFAHNEVMYNYFDLYKMRLVAGKFFDKTSRPDEVVINNSAATRLGYSNPKDAIGKVIFVKHKKMDKRIVGVVADFNQESLKFRVEPVVFHLESEHMWHTSAVKIAGGDFKSAIAFLQSTWMKIFPESEFVYSVFSDDVDRLYANELKLQRWLKFFCFLTLLICSFCIFVVTYYSFKEKEREVAIHKILGASPLNMLKMTRSFLVLIILSIIIGFLISTFLVGKWLQNYAYHASIDVWFFLIPILTVFGFYSLTLFYSVYKAISVNPVQTLRVQ